MTIFTSEQVIFRAKDIYRERYPDALFCVASGSIIQGQGTIGSDLDMIVLYEHLDYAYREAFVYDGLPVEAFVHDPETLQAFIDSDYRSAHPAMYHMMATGIVVPVESGISLKLRDYGIKKMAEGAPVLNDEGIEALRYVVSDLIDDLKGERPLLEQRAILYALYQKMGELYLRYNRQFSTTGKRLARQLNEADPHFLASLDRVMLAGHTEKGIGESDIELLMSLIERTGGFLFDGYYRAAPVEMRKKAEWL